MNLMTFSLFPCFGRASLRVVSPEGNPEDEDTVTAIFHGILKATAARLVELGRGQEAKHFLAAVPRDVSIDLEAMLRAGYRLEGIPAPVWDLILTR